MRARRRLIGFACAACALLALPAGASASTEVLPAQGPTASFKVRGSHGYAIEFAISQGSSEINVEKGPALRASADYSRPAGVAAGGRVITGFGPLAKISARFVPSGRVVRHDEEAEICKGGPEVVRFGTFVGTIRFFGENGYTRFASKRARGTVSSAPRQVCSFPTTGRNRHPHHGDSKAPLRTTFSAESSTGITFLATQSDRNPTAAEFIAFTSERRGDLSIFRTAFVSEAPASAFAFDPDLNTATVAPPAPFSGSATFQRIDDFASRWEGPLTISLPGKPNLPLTGRDFSWALTREREGSSSGLVSISFGRAGP